jgi:hypothetical protein
MGGMFLSLARVRLNPGSRQTAKIWA